MKTFNDRMILNKEDFEIAMKQELKNVRYGWTTEYMANKFNQVLIDNIHEYALKLNNKYDKLNMLDINSIWPTKILELSSCLGAINTAKFFNFTRRSQEELLNIMARSTSYYGILFDTVDKDSIHIIKEKTKL